MKARKLVYFVVFALALFLAIGYLSLNATGGEKPLANQGKKNKDGQDGTRIVTVTSGGNFVGTQVRQSYRLRQDEYPTANDFHFKAWQKEDGININGWLIRIDGFSNSSSVRGNQPPPYDGVDNGQHAVDVDADGSDIPNGAYIDVEVTFWLTSYNTVRLGDLVWTLDGEELDAVPDQGWEITYPQPDPGVPGQYIHKLIIANDDFVKGIFVSNIKYIVTMDYYPDLGLIDFNSSYAQTASDFSLGPLSSKVIYIYTTTPLYGGHIYFKYDVAESVRGASAPSPVFENTASDHPITKPEWQ